MNSLLCRTAKLAALTTIGATLVTGCASSNGTPAPLAADNTAQPTTVTIVFQGKDETGNLAMERHLTEVAGTLSLKAGTIQLAGVVSPTPSFSLTVTGGTGSFARVTGTVDFKNDNNAQTLTVHLFKPVA